MDFSKEAVGDFTNHDFMENSLKLIKILQKLSPDKISKLMDLSQKLAELNYQRYQDFSSPFNKENARQAIFAFKGDVYDGIGIESFSKADIKYSQKHLRIISGLYGLLRPLDLIQPYRLEMGTKLANKNGKDLYKFWGNNITEKLNGLLKENNKNILVNLASGEYFKAVNQKKINGSIITPIFKEKKGSGYKIVMLFAKRARGMMASYIIKNRIENIEDIKLFNNDGYQFNSTLSTENELIFTR
jgi:cytoplasmic iron level regulating protein YaaA (DUF328/UPF0246 family)